MQLTLLHNVYPRKKNRLRTYYSDSCNSRHYINLYRFVDLILTDNTHLCPGSIRLCWPASCYLCTPVVVHRYPSAMRVLCGQSYCYTRSCWPPAYQPHRRFSTDLPQRCAVNTEYNLTLFSIILPPPPSPRYWISTAPLDRTGRCNYTVTQKHPRCF